MNNILRQVETEDIVFFKENQYSPENRKQFLASFEKMVQDGHIVTVSFKETQWMCYSGIKKFGIDFCFSESLYQTHIGKEFGITYKTMVDMLKCFAIYNMGVFIFATIRDRIKAIKRFLTEYGDPAYKESETFIGSIKDFLAFIGTDEVMITALIQGIRLESVAQASTREMRHLINYLAIDNEINDLYRSGPPKEEFIHWFPIFFWCKITFIIPLRATEMLVTPYECLDYENGELFLSLRRTMLKKGKHTVYYDVQRDYKVYRYKIPETNTIRIIQQYQELTRHIDRPYLFAYSPSSVNQMLSLQAFNDLLEEFVSTYLIGNRKYDYARFATGIQEFEMPTAGDSRPLAMANLYYQNVGADICRQIAGHVNINTSAGYYTNVGNTVLASSVMHLQRRLNNGEAHIEELASRASTHEVISSSCSSPCQPKVTGNVTDCIAENHCDECFGCRYDNPSAEQVYQSVSERKTELNCASKRILECMENIKHDGDRFDFDKVFLDAHTAITRLRTAADIQAGMEAVRWARHKNTQTTSC